MVLQKTNSLEKTLLTAHDLPVEGHVLVLVAEIEFQGENTVRFYDQDVVRTLIGERTGEALIVG